MQKISLAAIYGIVLGFIVMGLSLYAHKLVQEAPQIAAECPPGLAEQAAKKGAEYAKPQADFEALKKGSK